MAKERRAHVVYYDPHADGEHESLTALNELLNDGWLPISTAGMGGAGSGSATTGGEMGYAALVILERQKDYAVSGFGG